MDEPFGALDAQTRTIMQEDLSEMFVSEKRTVSSSPQRGRGHLSGDGL